MKKVLLLTAAVLALAAPMAAAQGINLAVGNCIAGLGGSNANSTCASNVGATILVSSVIPPSVPNFVGAAWVLDLQTDSPTLPDWFQLGTGGCRAGRISASFDFTGGPFDCIDPWFGQASGGINYDAQFEGVLNRARIKMVAAVAVGVPLSAGDEHYMAKTTILNQLTTGTGACAGCLTPACIVLNSILLAQPAGEGDYFISNPATSQHVTWQGGGTLDCPGATPTQSNTWGQLKSLYR